MTNTLLQQKSESPLDATVVALVAEFDDVDAVMTAAQRTRDAGYLVWDVHSPFPIHGMPKAMGLRPTILPWISLAHGLLGMLLGLMLVWWTNAVTIPGIPTELQGYVYLVSGKPRFSFAANVPILFELTVLLAAFGTVLGMLGLNKLPMLHNPLFRSRAVRRATIDGFALTIESEDPRFDPAGTRTFLESLGPLRIEAVTEPKT